MEQYTLRLPQALWALGGLPQFVACSGGTARDALDDAVRRVPGLLTYLTPGAAQLPRSILLFADGERVSDLNDHLVEGTRVLRLLIPSAGG